MEIPADLRTCRSAGDFRVQATTSAPPVRGYGTAGFGASLTRPHEIEDRVYQHPFARQHDQDGDHEHDYDETERRLVHHPTRCHRAFPGQ